jgi:hypothetical protein
VIELEDHPFFIASQFHPEFKSRPERPAPLFRGFIEAALARAGGERPAEGEDGRSEPEQDDDGADDVRVQDTRAAGSTSGRSGS